MAITERVIGHVTLNNEVELEDQHYKIGYWNKSGDYFELSIPRELVEREFHARGKTRGVFSFYYGNDEEPHELTFEEWVENVDYRDEFDAFIQQLASEQLHLEELREAKEINVRFFAQNSKLIHEYETKIRSLEKLLYEAINPQVKKAS